MKNPKELLANYSRRMGDPHEIYYMCKEIDGYPGDGTSIMIAARVYKFHMVFDRQFFYEPISTFDKLLEITWMKNLLNDQHVPRKYLDGIQVSFDIFESAYTAPLGRLSLPHTNEVSKGNHAVALTGGYENSGESLQFINSWGRKWGDNGYGFVSREYLERYMNEAWLCRRARFGPSKSKIARLTKRLDDKEFAHFWMLENPRWRKKFRYHGHGHQLVNYETWSTSEECCVDIIEIRNGNGFPLGWTYVFHLGKEQRGISRIKELFVWPFYRRQGYGSILESQACERALMMHSKKIQLLFHDWDAMIRVRAAGRIFANKRGYTWRWRKNIRPNIEAIGEKSL